MCSSSHSSFSRTSTLTGPPLFNFVPASVGKISVTFFFASATSFSKRLCSAISQSRFTKNKRQIIRKFRRSGGDEARQKRELAPIRIQRSHPRPALQEVQEYSRYFA